MSLSSTLKSIQDVMRRDPGLDGDAQRLGQLAWMLFHLVSSRAEAALDAAPGYRSPIPPGLRWRALAQADPSALVRLVDGDLFPTLAALDPAAFPAGRSRDRAALVGAVFADTRNHMRSGALLAEVMRLIDADLDLGAATPGHLLGDIYETLLGDLQSAGNAGEFYTPRALTRFVVDRLAPRPGETVLDPACGTGGFLTCALQHAGAGVHLRGVEKKPLPHLLCVTNLILHGVDVPSGVRRGNLLAQPLSSHPERVDVVVSNPPFGGREERGVEQNVPARWRTRDTADLFLVHIIELLRDGGRAAVVLPDGFLFGRGVKARIKERLLRACDLHTVVRLPTGVFAPYTSIRTNVLFFTKGVPTRETWFYEQPAPSGWSYSKTRPMQPQDLDAARAWWGERVEGPRAWRVPIHDIVASGYDLDRHHPGGGGDVHEDPSALQARYDRALDDVSEAACALRDALAAALGR